MTEIKNVDIKSLKLLDRNPRKITKEAMDKLIASIQKDPEFLHNRPVLVNDKDGVLQVYAGNQRVQAAKKMKWKSIPCIVDKDLPEEVVKDRVIKDNKTYGEFDYDILAADYEVEHLLDAGFTPQELEYDVQDLGSTEEDEGDVLEPGKDEEADTKLGDIYELNQHRLVCGDSTLPEYVEKVLNGKEPILMVTDPPYGVEYDASWRNSLKREDKYKKTKNSIGKVQNDDKADWRLSYFLFPGSVVYVWHADKMSHIVSENLIDCEYEIKYQIIWVKQSGFGRGDYHHYHEPCWYAVKKGCNHNWQGDRKQRTVWEIQSRAACGDTSQNEEATGHSTQKPIECMARPIRNNTCEGEGVYDPFLGSGTTLIAAEQLNRVCYGIELSCAYVDICVKRWIKYMKKNNREIVLKKNGENINPEIFLNAKE